MNNQHQNHTPLGRHHTWNVNPTLKKIIQKTSQIFFFKPKTQSTMPERTGNSPTTSMSSTNTFLKYNSEFQTQSSLPEEPFKQQVMTCIVPITLLSILADLLEYQLVSVSPPLKVHTVVSHVVVHTPLRGSCRQTESLTQTIPALSRSPCTTSHPNHTSYDAETELLNLYSNVSLPRKSDKPNSWWTQKEGKEVLDRLEFS